MGGPENSRFSERRAIASHDFEGGRKSGSSENIGRAVLMGREHSLSTWLLCTDPQHTVPSPMPVEGKMSQWLCNIALICFKWG